MPSVPPSDPSDATQAEPVDLESLLSCWFEHEETAADWALDPTVFFRARVPLAEAQPAALQRFLRAIGRDQGVLDHSRPLVPGASLGGYRLEALLGEGGMGQVWKAYPEAGGPALALKVATSKAGDRPERQARLEREAHIVTALAHPHIVPVLKMGRENGRPFLAMRLLDGQTLDQLHHRLDAVAAATMGASLADALAHAHESGVLHRDVTPSNICLEDEHPWLLDFGLAWRAEDPALTRSQDMPGTLPYMAPESLSGGRRAMGPAVDIYGLAATLWFAVTGHPPFRGRRDESLVRAILLDAPDASHWPEGARDLEVVLRRALEKDPRHRFPDADGFREELVRVAAARKIESRPPGSLRKLWRFGRRRPRLTAAVLSAVLLLGVTGYQAYDRAGKLATLGTEVEGQVRAALERGDPLGADRALRGGEGALRPSMLQQLRGQQRAQGAAMDQLDRVLASFFTGFDERAEALVKASEAESLGDEARARSIARLAGLTLSIGQGGSEQLDRFPGEEWDRAAWPKTRAILEALRSEERAWPEVGSANPLDALAGLSLARVGGLNIPNWMGFEDQGPPSGYASRLHYLAGAEACHRGDLDRAESLLRGLVKHPRLGGMARLQLVRVAIYRNDLVSAERWFASAGSLPQTELMRRIVACELTLKRDGAAAGAQAAQQLVEAHPRVLNIRSFAAGLLLELDQHEAAGEMLEAHPADAPTWNWERLARDMVRVQIRAARDASLAPEYGTVRAEDAERLAGEAERLIGLARSMPRTRELAAALFMRSMAHFGLGEVSEGWERLAESRSSKPRESFPALQFVRWVTMALDNEVQRGTGLHDPRWLSNQALEDCEWIAQGAPGSSYHEGAKNRAEACIHAARLALYVFDTSAAEAWRTRAREILSEHGLAAEANHAGARLIEMERDLPVLVRTMALSEPLKAGDLAAVEAEIDALNEILSGWGPEARSREVKLYLSHQKQQLAAARAGQ